MGVLLDTDILYSIVLDIHGTRYRLPDRRYSAIQKDAGRYLGYRRSSFVFGYPAGILVVAPIVHQIQYITGRTTKGSVRRMIFPSVIYAVITVLLALIDALRIKYAQGKQENINHEVSVALAVFAGMAAFGFSRMDLIGGGWVGLWQMIPIFLGFIAIRFLLYDPFLNAFRHLPIDYESSTTSSYVDNHSRPIPFWEKRLFAAVGWGVVLITYHLIFKSW